MSFPGFFARSRGLASRLRHSLIGGNSTQQQQAPIVQTADPIMQQQMNVEDVMDEIQDEIQEQQVFGASNIPDPPAVPPAPPLPPKAGQCKAVSVSISNLI